MSGDSSDASTDVSIAALIDQVYAAPDDDHVRHVLADALIARGDPRGELIQLQLQPATDHERRAMRLIQRHGLTWLGGLRGAVVPLAYERGFLAACMVVVDDALAVIDRPEWSTVHTIELPSASFTRFALHPVMRSLKRLVGLGPGLLLNLAKFPQLATLTVEVSYDATLVRVLGRYLPANAVGALVIHRVPADQVAAIGSASYRHRATKFDIRSLPPPPEPDDPYDDVDE